MTCRMCACTYYGSSSSSFCSPECRKLASVCRKSKQGRGGRRGDRIGKINPRDSQEADAYLRAAVAFEVAPPWERHPEPWDPRDIAPRRGGQ